MSIKIGIGKIRIFHAGGGISWSSYWATRTPSGLTAVPFSDSQVDLSLTENGSGFDGYSWERSEDNGVTYVEIGTTLIGDVDTADTTFTEPMILKYRARAYKGTHYSPYTSVVTVYPAGIRVSSVNTSVEIADASSEFYFNDGAGNDLPFSILAVCKSNDLSVGNTLIYRGNALGMSWWCHVNTIDGSIDWSIYGNDAATIQIYKKTKHLAPNEMNNDLLVNKLAFTYSGNKSHTGMKIYKNGVVAPAYEASSADYGVYVNMNNRAGVYAGDFKFAEGYYGRCDIYTLLVANIELSQAQITEFQNMIEESDISSLSYYANLKLVDRFAGTLNSDVGSHNGTSVDTTYFFNNYMTDGVVENGTEYLPEVTETTFQNTFKNFKLGWIMHFGIETFGDELAMDYPAPAPTTFNIATVNVASWATLAASYSKIDYAILTVSHGYGFSLYDHKTAVWRGTQRTNVHGTLPTYSKYDVGVTTSDKNILQKFVSEFNAVNIKPILYYQMAISINWTGNDYIINHNTDEAFQFAYYHNYVRERLQEIAALNPFAIWIDALPYYPIAYLHELYNSIKAINPAVGIIYNCYNNLDRSDNTFFPFDSTATEEGNKPALPSDDWWTLTQTYGGITYPCVRELAVTSFQNARWFYNAASHALRPLVDLQAEYDYAKAAGVPCCIAVSPMENGLIYEDQADLVGSIVL